MAQDVPGAPARGGELAAQALRAIVERDIASEARELTRVRWRGRPRLARAVERAAYLLHDQL